MSAHVMSSVADLFGVGTTVGAYLPNPIPGASSPVTGAALTTAVVAADGSLSFSGLVADTAYVAYDSGGGKQRRFRTAPVATTDYGLLAPFPPQTFDMRVMATIAAQTASRTSYGRVEGSPLLISKLGIFVGVQSGNVAVAVYDNVGSGLNARPNNRLATSGSVACPAAGDALISLDVPVMVYPGYWLALACDNATATFGKQNVSAMATLGLMYCCQQNAAYPPPAQAASLAQAASAWWLVGAP